jgi:hypothetical protein
MGKPKVTSGGSDVYTIRVRGDKHTQNEAGEHRILFPGGYVAVTRTQDNEYWAHIGIHKEYDGDDEKRPGRLVNARIDCTDKATHEANLGDLSSPNLQHLAIRIQIAETFINEPDKIYKK